MFTYVHSGYPDACPHSWDVEGDLVARGADKSFEDVCPAAG